MTCPKNKARPIRHPAQVPDRNGKIFYTSITSLSHISKLSEYDPEEIDQGIAVDSVEGDEEDDDETEE